MVNQYVFEFKYKKKVFGKEKELMNQIDVLDNNYNSACEKAIAHVQKNFSEYWCANGSSFKYVGERVNGVVKPFVEEVKEEEKMWMGKSKKDLVNLNKGLLIDVGVHKNEIKTLRQRCDNNQQKIECLINKRNQAVRDRKYLEGVCENQQEQIEGQDNKITELRYEITKQNSQIHSLEKRVKEFEEKQKEMKAEYKGGYFDCKKMNPSSVYGFNLISRGSGKQDFLMNYQQRVMEELLNRTSEFENPISKRISDAILKHETKVYDVNSMYPQAVDVCNVYQIERDQALKENESLVNKVSGYKKELGKLNLLMDDMENRLEKELIVRQGMNNQMKKWKAEMKRKNKIIDVLTEDKK